MADPALRSLRVITGHEHNDYTSRTQRAALDRICELLQTDNHPALRTIASAANVPYSTVQGWAQQVARDPKWRPNHTNHGEGHRMFTDAEENEMAETIRT
jgi:hypothetical protein